MESRSDLITRLMRAEIRGWQDFVGDLDYAVDLTVEKYAADQGLDREQQRLQAEAQLDLLVTPATTANGLFWMSDEKIGANLETMRLLGIDVGRDLFSTAILEEIYQGRTRIE